MKRAFVLVLVLVCSCFAGMSKSVSFSNSELNISGAVKAEDGNNYLEIGYGNGKKILDHG